MRGLIDKQTCGWVPLLLGHSRRLMCTRNLFLVRVRNAFIGICSMKQNASGDLVQMPNAKCQMGLQNPDCARGALSAAEVCEALGHYGSPC